MTENYTITDEAFYDAKKRCGSDHVMLLLNFHFVTE